MNSKWGQAYALLEAKKYEQAIPLFKELLSEVDESFKIEVAEKLAICFSHTGQLDEAEDYLSSAAESAIMAQDHVQLVRVQITLSFLAVLQRQGQLALYHLGRATATYEKLKRTEKTDDLYVKVLLQYAITSQCLGNVHQAASCLQELVVIHNRLNDAEVLVKMNLDVAETYRYLGDPSRSAQHTENAVGLFDHIIDRKMATSIRCRLIVLQADEINWEESVRQLLQFAERYEEQGDLAQAGETYTDVAIISLRYAAVESAILYATRALELLSNKHAAKGKAHRVLAEAYLLSEKWAEFEQHSKRAVAMFARLSLFRELDEATTFLSRTFGERGMHQASAMLLNKLKSMMLNRLFRRGIVL